MTGKLLAKDIAQQAVKGQWPARLLQDAMKIQSNVRLAQFVAALAIVLSLISVVVWLRTAGAAATFGDWFDEAGFSVAVTLVLAPLGALILTRQPGNMVGWLLLIGAWGRPRRLPIYS